VYDCVADWVNELVRVLDADSVCDRVRDSVKDLVAELVSDAVAVRVWVKVPPRQRPFKPLLY